MEQDVCNRCHPVFFLITTSQAMSCQVCIKYTSGDKISFQKELDKLELKIVLIPIKVMHLGLRKQLSQWSTVDTWYHYEIVYKMLGNFGWYQSLYKPMGWHGCQEKLMPT